VAARIGYEMGMGSFWACVGSSHLTKSHIDSIAIESSVIAVSTNHDVTIQLAAVYLL
jgi:ribulose 1,5-bisphosphate synthetase/thiazole synthase